MLKESATGFMPFVGAEIKAPFEEFEADEFSRSDPDSPAQ